MTSHRDSHTIIDVKPEIIPGVQNGNGISHDKYNIRGTRHCPYRHKQKRRYFHAKTNTTSAKLYIYIGVWARDLYIDEAHTVLDVFRFAAFFLVRATFGTSLYVCLHHLVSCMEVS